MPGVAIGEGKVFVALRDGHLIALDQLLGTPITGWNVEVLPTTEGRPPVGGPDLLQRARPRRRQRRRRRQRVATACTPSRPRRAARSGRGRSCPAQNQPGGNTWAASADNNYGGGAMWESPIIDPKLNLAIFGTGNPVPWNSRGPGKNLFTDSIVALNVYTGQLVWYYQTTHHDLWDSDLPNNGVNFDALVQDPDEGRRSTSRSGSRCTGSTRRSRRRRP